MTGPFLLIGVLMMVVASLIVVKIATIALMLTGLAEERARFQALSAFTGTGFTTREAELVMSNQRRRKIIMILMIMGHSTLVVVMATLMASFIKSRGIQIPLQIVGFAILLYILYRVVSRGKWLRRWDRSIEDWITRRRVLEEKTVEDVIQFNPHFGIVEVRVRPDSDLVGKTLSDLMLTRDNILVLNVIRGHRYISVPIGSQDLQADDHLVLYGNRQRIMEKFGDKE